MGKKFDKTVKNNAVTYIMVIVAWLVMMALQQAGMLNSSTTGLLPTSADPSAELTKPFSEIGACRTRPSPNF